MPQYIQRYVPRMNTYTYVELVKDTDDLPQNAVFFCTDDLWEDDECYVVANYYITGDSETVWCVDEIWVKA